MKNAVLVGGLVAMLAVQPSAQSTSDRSTQLRAVNPAIIYVSTARYVNDYVQRNGAQAVFNYNGRDVPAKTARLGQHTYFTFEQGGVDHLVLSLALGDIIDVNADGFADKMRSQLGYADITPESFRKYQLNILSARDEIARIPSSSNDTKKNPEVRGGLFDNQVPKEPIPDVKGRLWQHK